MIKYHLPILLSSSTAAGAINKSANGSSFSVSLEQPILIPKSAKYCWLVCQSAELWNTVPNILAGVNDKLYIDDSFGALVITIPEGLYSINLLNAEINRQIVESGRANDAIVIIGNNATQKTAIGVQEAGTQIDFTQSDTFREILGFESILITTTLTNEIVDATNVAQFNVIDYFILHTDLVSRGLRINNKYTQAVAQVLIESPPGDQIIHQPQNPPEIPAQELIGSKRNFINVWLTDQNNRRVSTAGENYAMRLVIYYLA